MVAVDAIAVRASRIADIHSGFFRRRNDSHKIYFAQGIGSLYFVFRVWKDGKISNHVLDAKTEGFSADEVVDVIEQTQIGIEARAFAG